MRQSVLQDWVAGIPLRAQGTLLTAVRGCDLTPKYPLDSVERRLVGSIRAAFMVPADRREVDAEPGCFFISEPPLTFKASAIGHYPLHWVSHVLHASEVIAYYHPDTPKRAKFLAVYAKLVSALHLNLESPEECHARFTEDRIANGNIVG